MAGYGDDATSVPAMLKQAIIALVSHWYSFGSAEEKVIKNVLQSYGIIKTNDQVVVEIWGSGSPMREFLWSEDMAEACVFLMENRNFSDCFNKGNEIRNTHLNIGSGLDISIADLANKIKKEVNFNGNFSFNTNIPDGTFKKLTDVSKINALGWNYSVTIERGINEIYKWYKNR